MIHEQLMAWFFHVTLWLSQCDGVPIAVLVLELFHGETYQSRYFYLT
jgi:hypothetical protein